jgi:hypothetical protein
VESKCRFESDTLDDIRATPCPKMPPSEENNTYGVSQYNVSVRGSTVLNLNLPLVTALGITGKERRTTCTQLDQ